MARYINPFTDFGFKTLFGTELNKDLLADFLNQLLPEHHRIVDLEYRRTEQLGKSELDRKAIFDIYCQSSSGERFIVEMQKAKQLFFKERSLFYATFPIQEQAKQGNDWNFDFKAVYCIALLDFVFDAESSLPYIHTVRLRDDHHGKVFLDKLTFIFVELPKFGKQEGELESQKDRWLYFIKNLAKLEAIPPSLHDRLFEKAFEKAEIARFNPEERDHYQASLKYYWDINNVIDTSKEEGKAEGKVEGKAEGLAEGLAQGKAEGLAQGKAEGLAEGALETAKAIALDMIEDGDTDQKISKVTKLNLDLIAALREAKIRGF